MKKRYIITVKVVSDDGTKPITRSLGGDCVFVALSDGQRATWTVREDKPPRKR